MIFLLLAILTSTLIVVTFKLFERFNISITQAITVNYLFAAVFGFFTLETHVVIADIFCFSWFRYAIIVGITLIVIFNVFAVSAQKAGVAITAVSSKMSVVIPVIIGFVMYKESASWMKIAGVIIALVAFYLSFKKKGSLAVAGKYWYLPVLLFLGNGLNDSMLKFVQQFFSVQYESTYFLAVAFSVSLLIGIFVLVYQLVFKGKKLHALSLLAGVWLGFLNWYSTLFFVKGLGVMDVSVFIPVFNASIVSLAALIGYFVFKEKLSKINWMGIGIAIAAIVIITNT